MRRVSTANTCKEFIVYVRVGTGFCAFPTAEAAVSQIARSLQSGFIEIPRRDGKIAVKDLLFVSITCQFKTWGSRLPESFSSKFWMTRLTEQHKLWWFWTAPEPLRTYLLWCKNLSSLGILAVFAPNSGTFIYAFFAVDQFRSQSVNMH